MSFISPIRFLYDLNPPSDQNSPGQIDTTTGVTLPTMADSSLFNPFYVFKYTGGTALRDKGIWFNNNPTSDSKKAAWIRNPTAKNIIEWSKSEVWGDGYQLPYSPYSWSDFIFCKHYGIIPNNRLVTLRKYPVGVNDSTYLSKTSANNIPVAQAVTWFGDVSGNDINNLWQKSWNITWNNTGDTGFVQNVSGNEITNISQGLTEFLGKNPNTQGLTNLLKTLGNVIDGISSKNGNPSMQEIREAILKNGANADLQKKIQNLSKNAYSSEGAYWNQINGPVNVLTKFNYRGRGLSDGAINTDFTLKFHYRTDSYFGLSQRRVALDILANMLALTYSDGEWLENINAYYEQLGIKISDKEQELFEKALNGGNVDPTELVKAIASTAKTRLSTALTFLKDIGQKEIPKAAESLSSIMFAAISNKEQNFDPSQFTNIEDFEKSYPNLALVLETSMVQSIAGTLPEFIQKRANVAGVPTGNWHLTIGNPMNPIMRIGNLACFGCTCTFNDELGPDDFPTEMTFEVKLRPMTPRDGKGLRKMFDIGKGDYITSQLGATSDQVNTYGANSKAMSDLSVGNVPSGVVDNKADYVKKWIGRTYGNADGTQPLTPDTVDRLNNLYFFKPNLALEKSKATSVQTKNP